MVCADACPEGTLPWKFAAVGTVWLGTETVCALAGKRARQAIPVHAQEKIELLSKDFDKIKVFQLAAKGLCKKWMPLIQMRRSEPWLL